MTTTAIAMGLGNPAAPGLTKAKENMILMFIRAGATDYVACEAAGISKATFDRWMESSAPTLADFQTAVREASAQARVRAEVRVAATDPEKWLRYGPGRDRPGRPGWTSGRVEVTGLNGAPVQVTPGIDLTKLDDHELAQLEALYTKARPGSES